MVMAKIDNCIMTTLVRTSKMNKRRKQNLSQTTRAHLKKIQKVMNISVEEEVPKGTGLVPLVPSRPGKKPELCLWRGAAGLIVLGKKSH